MKVQHNLIFPSMASSNTTNGDEKMRVFFIPLFATGHIFPMVELACLFAARRNIEPTLVLTPSNADLVRPILDRSAASGSHVKLHIFQFPDVGLPPGVENLGTAPSSDSWRIYKAVDLCKEIHGQILRDHRPDAVVADIPYWWTTAIAAELRIPRITYHCVGVFGQLAMNNLFKIRAQIQRMDDDDSRVVVPEFPGPRIEIPRSELPNFVLSEDHLSEAWAAIKASQLESYGVVVNTFQELEPEYCDLYRRVDAKRAWFVGPLALATKNRHSVDASAENNQCLRWLENKEKGSVLYVCFGSWCFFDTAQLHETAAGLEASGRPFMWVLRNSQSNSKDEEQLPTGWEERVKEQGIVVKEWAPQVAILEHPAVGAFMSHCGWNSVLEAVAAGKPMLTWPLVFEQFINERLVVEVLGTARRVWDGRRCEAAERKTLVPGEAIGKMVRSFWEGEREKVTEKASAMAKAAARAADGKKELDCMIDELLGNWRQRKGCDC